MRVRIGRGEEGEFLLAIDPVSSTDWTTSGMDNLGGQELGGVLELGLRQKTNDRGKDRPMTRQIDPLTVDECRELLKDHHFGRLAFVDSVGVLPMIIPVNYVLDEDAVVFRTEAGSKLRTATRGAPVAFEVDGVDRDRRGGWSVVVRGHAKEVTDPTKLGELRRAALVPWAPGAKPHYVKVNPSQVIGSRITSDEDLPLTWLG